MEQSKKFWQSRTTWFNALTILTVGATFFFGYQSDPILAEKTLEVLVVVTPVVNLILRAITSKAVTL